MTHRILQPDRRHLRRPQLRVPPLYHEPPGPAGERHVHRLRPHKRGIRQIRASGRPQGGNQVRKRETKSQVVRTLEYW